MQYMRSRAQESDRREPDLQHTNSRVGSGPFTVDSGGGTAPPPSESSTQQSSAESPTSSSDLAAQVLHQQRWLAALAQSQQSAHLMQQAALLNNPALASQLAASSQPLLHALSFANYYHPAMALPPQNINNQALMQQLVQLQLQQHQLAQLQQQHVSPAPDLNGYIATLLSQSQPVSTSLSGQSPSLSTSRPNIPDLNASTLQTSSSSEKMPRSLDYESLRIVDAQSNSKVDNDATNFADREVAVHKQIRFRDVSPEVIAAAESISKDSPAEYYSTSGSAASSKVSSPARIAFSTNISSNPSTQRQNEERFNSLVSSLSASSFEESDDTPLATQMWRFFSKSKAALPHGARMENLSWRLGGMKIGQSVLEKEKESTPLPEQPRQSTSSAVSGEIASQQALSPRDEQDFESRGRKSRSVGNTPDDSSSKPEPMDWKAQSRSRSRAPRHIVDDMDWRASSRSRSRARRLSLPDFTSPPLVQSEPNTAVDAFSLDNLQPSTLQEQDLYTSLFGASANQLFSAAPSPLSVGQSDTVHNYESFANIEWATHTGPLNDPIPDVSQWFEELPKTLPNRSYNLDPSGSTRKNASIPGLQSEQNEAENQSVDFGFLPKLVRKTSADANFHKSLAALREESGLSRIVQPKEQIPSINPPSKSSQQMATLSTLDLAALGRPAPKQKSVVNLSGLSATKAPAPAQDYAAFASAFREKANPPVSPAAATPYSTGSFFNNPFTSLPNTPSMQNPIAYSPQGYFGFPSFAPPPITSNFVDPNILLNGPSVSTSTTPAYGLSPTTPLFVQSTTDNPWLVSPNVSRPPSPGFASPTSVLPDGTLADNDFASGLAFSGGPQRSAAGPSKRKSEHVRSQSLSTAPGSQLDKVGDGLATCSNCGTSNTPLWRRDEAGKPLCNGCGLFKKLHGVDRPLSLATGVIKKRNRSKLKDTNKPSTTKSKRKPSSSKPETL